MTQHAPTAELWWKGGGEGEGGGQTYLRCVTLSPLASPSPFLFSLLSLFTLPFSLSSPLLSLLSYVNMYVYVYVQV